MNHLGSFLPRNQRVTVSGLGWQVLFVKRPENNYNIPLRM
jgi:hypothetical protein